MFGRVRASSSSPDDLERSTAKLLKHDSLSIYECTLLKLRVGSRHAQDTSHIALYPENDVMDTEADENCALALSPKAKISSQQERMTVDDAASTSASTFRTDGSYHHLPISRPHSSRNPSVIYLFSRYKGPKDPSSHDKKMKPEVGCSSGISPSSGIDVDKQVC